MNAADPNASAAPSAHRASSIPGGPGAASRNGETARAVRSKRPTFHVRNGPTLRRSRQVTRTSIATPTPMSPASRAGDAGRSYPRMGTATRRTRPARKSPRLSRARRGSRRSRTVSPSAMPKRRPNANSRPQSVPGTSRNAAAPTAGSARTVAIEDTSRRLANREAGGGESVPRAAARPPEDGRGGGTDSATGSGSGAGGDGAGGLGWAGGPTGAGGGVWGPGGGRAPGGAPGAAAAFGGAWAARGGTAGRCGLACG